MRIAEALAQAAARLAAAHVGSPRVDAELLAAHVLGVPRGRLRLAGEFDAGQARRFNTLVDRRAQRVPLQHLTGLAPFRHLELAVGPGVFVPRPETEVLVEWGLRWLAANAAAKTAANPAANAGADPTGNPASAGPAARDAAATPIVVDVCAGSGAVAAAVASERPGTRVYAVERDEVALGWLRRNVAPYQVIVVAGDATAPATLAELDGTVDLVLGNPPYVPAVGAAGLPAEVVEHDPPAAVFGGVDGLEVIRPLIGRIAALLRPRGALAIEHDDTHAYVVPTLVAADRRLTDVRLHHDLARRPRFTTATRAEAGGRMADLPP